MLGVQDPIVHRRGAADAVATDLRNQGLSTAEIHNAGALVAACRLCWNIQKCTYYSRCVESQPYNWHLSGDGQFLPPQSASGG